MSKQLIILTFLLLSFSFAQIDTLQESTESTTFSVEQDSASMYNEYYEKGYQEARNGNYIEFNSINNFYVYHDSLNAIQWADFKKGFEEGIIQNRSVLLPDIVKAGMFGCAGIGVYFLGGLLLLLIIGPAG